MIQQGNSDLYTFAWPVSRVGEAIEVLIRKTGLLSAPMEAPTPPENLEQTDEEGLGHWIEFVAGRFDIEAEPVESPYTEVEQMLRHAGPALIRLSGRETPCFLALLRNRWRGISIITPELSVRTVSPQVIREALTAELEGPLTQWIDQLLIEAGIPEPRRSRVKTSVLKEQLSESRVRGCRLLRLSPGAGFRTHICRARVPHHLFILIGVHSIRQMLMFLGWWIIGKGVLQGYFDQAWLLAWALILFTAIPFHLLETWIQSIISLGAGTLFKQRLLYGTLRLEPEEVRHQGAGQFLGRVMESEALESMALEGGFTTVLSVIQLFMAAIILSMGVGEWPHSLSLLAWMTVIFLICWRYYQHNQNWTEASREMTNDLVEKMVGHRTRLAQEDDRRWHDEEDRALNHYLKLSERLDRVGMILSACASRGWLIVGLAGIAYSFVSSPDSQAKLAVTLGGIIFASQSLTSFVGGLLSLVGVRTAWDQAGPLFRAAARPGNSKSLSFILPSELDKNTDDDNAPILLSRDIAFRYHDYGRPVLRKCSLKICKGDCLLLEGPSGGGKSTLAALLAGLRVPESGLHLLRGVDWQTIGIQEWRKRVVAAPQFHENHVLTETFSFNLLMGRRWPPTREALEEAQIICRELGLGDLLDRMPAGLQQTVGESGWQLSHGERSRLYIARALLQKTDFIVLDESFAALDPENLHKAMGCVLRRTKTLLVIAHP
ncbi:ATP-binding cassette domain-containing protein [Desulfonema magnum]|uniref:ABC transporter, ATP-binding protein n=1 Tax=Desulfonema magnum TaxID=45655 RepID=A0A975BY50_9BACT|nr:ABC transporter ATP-binding protein [Desulfonema magnum]QTA93677.1 putative ABC transporter, ATP-binding protein [Desulfonema magnum]